MENRIQSPSASLSIGILAHVDAGKTTLAEALLYETGQLRRLGRVDHGSTALDTHTLERQRGITIFASQAVFSLGEYQITLLDTPGHVDFSAETERTLQVLDYAILVISGTDGVQAHTRTLWRLLRLYQVPTFIFVTKMDFARRTAEDLLSELRQELDGGCVDFSAPAAEERMETLAMCREDLLEEYLENGTVPESAVRELIAARQVFPVSFGSGLKLEGVEEFLTTLETYLQPRAYPADFGAKIFKISHDAQGNRLTHLKVTGGTLRVRDTVHYEGKEEKINQIRLYTGAKFAAAEEIPAGGVCAVLGLTETRGGQGLGREAASREPVLEPVMNYRIVLPEGCDARTMLPKLRTLEEEDPMLRITWNSHLQEIHVGLMGEVQTEILKSLIAERFGVAVEIDSGRVLYKETIAETVEGVGHYEPLRHYAEVHLLLRPLPLGSGLVLESQCSEDVLDRNWQRLILTHLAEKTHLGVQIGAPITDMKITLAAGRAHIKHTEGGDFRQATYRAVRQGLMQAKGRLLEPYYAFRLEVPAEQVGRAINDLRARCASFEGPEGSGTTCLLQGRAPVTTLNDYAMELAAYTGGRGRLQLELAGYDACHDPAQVIEAFGYDPEADLDNTPDSVFCAHGGGFNVKWNEVKNFMHLESCLEAKKPETPAERPRLFSIDERELEAIMEREFGPIRRREYTRPVQGTTPTATPKTGNKKEYIIVDGYNVIFAWDELKKLAADSLDLARTRLMDMLSCYCGFTQTELVLVFDAYRTPGNPGARSEYHNIRVAYTADGETADAYIERMAGDIGKNYRVRVVTSDNLIRLGALRSGVLRTSSGEFGAEVADVLKKIDEIVKKTGEKAHLMKLKDGKQ